MRPVPRGSALLIATIAMIIIAVIGVALVRFTQREVAGSAAGERHQVLIACAEAARGVLQSQFHALGINPKDITILGSDDDTTTPNPLDGPGGHMRAMGGHVGQDPVLVTVTQVEELPVEALATQKKVRNVTGRTPKTGLGGTPLKVTVHCQEGDLSSPTSGRQLEMEFGINFGL